MKKARLASAPLKKLGQITVQERELSLGDARGVPVAGLFERGQGVGVKSEEVGAGLVLRSEFQNQFIENARHGKVGEAFPEAFIGTSDFSLIEPAKIGAGLLREGPLAGGKGFQSAAKSAGLNGISSHSRHDAVLLGQGGHDPMPLLVRNRP